MRLPALVERAGTLERREPVFRVAVESIDGTSARVRAGGFSFVAAAMQRPANGRGLVSLRFERIRVGGAATDLPVTARATVRDAVFVGSALQYALRIADGPDVIAEVPYDGVHPLLQVGQEVALGWDQSGALLFADA